MAASREQVTRALGRIGDLPVMPEVVERVLRLTEEPDVDINLVSEAVQRDPALSAKLLKVSNSPFYGLKQVVGTLKLSLVILGVREVRNIVLGISVVEGLRDRGAQRLLDHGDFWQHSCLVAALGKKLGTHLRLNLQGEDFIAGLLHDIGKMVMWRQFGEDYEAVYNAGGGFGPALVEAEIEAFGFDHGDAGTVLAQTWNLPDSLADAIWCHHPGDKRDLRTVTDPRLAALVRISNLAARDDWEGGEDAPPSATDEAWEVLFEHHEPVAVEDRRGLLQQYVGEMREAPALAL